MAVLKISRMRKVYFLRFLYRVCVLIALALLFAVRPQTADIIQGTTVFEQFHFTHLLLYFLWGIWMFDMVFQIIPSSRWAHKRCSVAIIPLAQIATRWTVAHCAKGISRRA